MRVGTDQQQGLIAILDALGASSYSEDEIDRFLEAREIVMRSLNRKAEALLGELKAESLSTFTFNDTIVIVSKTNHSLSLRDVERFFALLRRFLIDSLVNRILFRGTISIGRFHANEDTNTVMGPAVTDAAAWYEASNWIGIHATPRTTILIDQLLEAAAGKNQRTHLMVTYDVPMRDGSTRRLKATNWPKAFFVDGMSPCEPGESRRAKLLKLLGQHQIPVGTEVKYTQTVDFFDAIVKSQQLYKQFGKTHPVKK